MTDQYAQLFGVPNVFPADALVGVYLHGTSTLATLFADPFNTPMVNPAAADVAGHLEFYADPQEYDLVWTAGDVLQTITVTVPPS